MTIKIPQNAAAISSATMTEYQMPSIPKTKGNSNTAAIWNTRVRKKAISAEVRPSFKAVKNPEPKIAIPMNRKESQ